MRLVGTFLFIIFTTVAYAQEFKPFKLNFSVGGAGNRSQDYDLGGVISLEPKFGFSDHFDLGLRLETGILEKSKDSNNANIKFIDSKVLSSTSVTGTYLFTTGLIRPFVGVGTGSYHIDGTTVTVINGSTSTNYTFDSQVKVGFLIRAGLKIGHITGVVEYNQIPNSKFSILQSSLGSENTYVSAKLGIDFWGGRRK